MSLSAKRPAMDPFTPGSPFPDFTHHDRQPLSKSNKTPQGAANQPEESPTDQQIRIAATQGDEVTLESLITAHQRELTPHQLFTICCHNPSRLVPLVASHYPHVMPNIFLYAPKEALLSSAPCIRECIRHGARVDVAEEGHPTPFSLFCQEPGLHTLVRDILNGTLIQGKQTDTSKRSLEEPSQHPSKRRRTAEQLESASIEIPSHFSQDGARDDSTRIKKKKQRTEEAPLSAELFSIDQPPQYLIDGLAAALRSQNTKAVAYFLPYRAILMGTESHENKAIATIALESGSDPCIKAVLENNIDIEAKPLWNLLKSSIQSKQQERIEEILLYLANKPPAAAAVLNVKGPGGDTLLHELAKQNPCHVQIIRRLIELGADPEATNDLQENFLCTMVKSDNASSALLLEDVLRAHITLATSLNTEEVNTLHYLAYFHTTEELHLLEKLLEWGADPLIPDGNYKNTLFHLLAQESDSTSSCSLRKILSMNPGHLEAALSAKNDNQQTILHILLNNESLDVNTVIHCLNLGADPFDDDSNRYTLFDLLADRQEPEALHLLKLLIEKYRVTLQGNRRMNAIFITQALLLHTTVDLDLVEMLLNILDDFEGIHIGYSANVMNLLATRKEAQAHELLTRFFSAHQGYQKKIINLLFLNPSQHYALVDYFINQDQLFTIRDGNGNTLLHLLTSYSSFNPVAKDLLWQNIIKHKEVLDLTNKSGETITHCILKDKSTDLNLVQRLFELSADPMIQDDNGNTLLHLLASHQDPDVLAFLVQLIPKDPAEAHSILRLKTKNKETIVHILVKNVYLDIEKVRNLLTLGADPRIKDKDGNTIFHLLAFRASENSDASQLLKDLVEQYASSVTIENAYYDLETRNKKGETVLCVAARGTDVATVKQLVHAGANIHTVDNEGNTILHHAASRENASISAFGLCHIAIDTLNNEQETPLQYWLRTHPKTKNVEYFNFLITKDPDLTLLKPRQLAICISLMDEEKFTQCESIFQKKMDLYNTLSSQDSDARFFKKFFSRYKKIFLQKKQKTDPLRRLHFQGHIKELSSPRDINSLKTELSKWLEELERLKLLTKSTPLGYTKSNKTHVKDAQWLCHQVLRTIDNQNYTTLVAEDNTGIQAVAIVALHPNSYVVEYLMTRPKNIPSMGAKGAVSRAPTSILVEVAKRTLAAGEKAFSLDSTESAESFYQALGFTKGHTHAYTIQDEALKALADS